MPKMRMSLVVLEVNALRDLVPTVNATLWQLVHRVQSNLMVLILV
jgi:hypothetical protein